MGSKNMVPSTNSTNSPNNNPNIPKTMNLDLRCLHKIKITTNSRIVILSQTLFCGQNQYTAPVLNPYEIRLLKILIINRNQPRTSLPNK